jgi:hypothetical protein
VLVPVSRTSEATDELRVHFLANRVLLSTPGLSNKVDKWRFKDVEDVPVRRQVFGRTKSHEPRSAMGMGGPKAPGIPVAFRRRIQLNEIFSRSHRIGA